ncbi:S1 family peptidase [Paenibacillus senegalensis]|uniref:S1 family peptidase n=1 Tax=Paenibacillus senegalensis TaxID=1465766 RepID=UPI000289FCA8|nr:serine protease [Paenibacillus senegalensis]
MKKILTLFVVLSLVFVCSVASAADNTVVKLAKIHSGAPGDPGRHYYFYGSGFWLEGGYVVTNYHVIDEIDEDNIFIADGSADLQYYAAEIIATDDEKDLALLKTDNVNHEYLTIARSVSAGEKVRIIGGQSEGFEELEGTILTLSSFATIRNRDQSISSATYRMAYDFSAKPGMSGSPVLNQNGEIVGVHTASVRDSNKGYAVMLEDLKAFVSEHLASNDSGEALYQAHWKESLPLILYKKSRFINAMSFAGIETSLFQDIIDLFGLPISVEN